MLLVLFLLICNFRNKKNSLSLTGFPHIGVFPGSFDQNIIVSLNVCLLVYFLSFKTAIEKIIYFTCFSQISF
jgi:hypothetical protein